MLTQPDSTEMAHAIFVPEAQRIISVELRPAHLYDEEAEVVADGGSSAAHHAGGEEATTSNSSGGIVRMQVPLGITCLELAEHLRNTSGKKSDTSTTASSALDLRKWLRPSSKKSGGAAPARIFLFAEARVPTPSPSHEPIMGAEDEEGEEETSQQRQPKHMLMSIPEDARLEHIQAVLRQQQQQQQQPVVGADGERIEEDAQRTDGGVDGSVLVLYYSEEKHFGHGEEALCLLCCALCACLCACCMASSVANANNNKQKPRPQPAGYNNNTTNYYNNNPYQQPQQQPVYYSGGNAPPPNGYGSPPPAQPQYYGGQQQPQYYGGQQQQQPQQYYGGQQQPVYGQPIYGPTPPPAQYGGQAPYGAQPL